MAFTATKHRGPAKPTMAWDQARNTRFSALTPARSPTAASVRGHEQITRLWRVDFRQALGVPGGRQRGVADEAQQSARKVTPNCGYATAMRAAERLRAGSGRRTRPAGGLRDPKAHRPRKNHSRQDPRGQADDHRACRGRRGPSGRGSPYDGPAEPAEQASCEIGKTCRSSSWKAFFVSGWRSTMADRCARCWKSAAATLGVTTTNSRTSGCRTTHARQPGWSTIRFLVAGFRHRSSCQRSSGQYGTAVRVRPRGHGEDLDPAGRVRRSSPATRPESAREARPPGRRPAIRPVRPRAGQRFPEHPRQPRIRLTGRRASRPSGVGGQTLRVVPGRHVREAGRGPATGSWCRR